MSQLFQQLNPQSTDARLPHQQNSPIANLFKKCKMMTNPLGYIKTIPGMNQVLDLVQQSGGDAQQFFYNLAEKKGVDPNNILNMFK